MIRSIKPKDHLGQAKLELARIDRMMAALRPKANKGDGTAVSTMLTLAKERELVDAKVRRLESLARLAQTEEDEDDEYYDGYA